MELNEHKDRIERADYIICGAGFFGATIAERIATELGKKVLVLDRRSHIGGNSYSEDDPETGVHFHTYGTHIFHTSNEKVWDYVNRFTEFNGYFHQVLTTYKDKVYQMPINLETINMFYDVQLRPYEVDAFLKKEIEKENIKEPKNFEEKAITMIGRPLYEAFIKGYTMKQWQKDPKDLPASILNRLPFRKSYNENYYFSRWQGIPTDGYGAIFEKMLKNDNIDILLNADFFDLKAHIPKSKKIIYTGPVDRYFDYKHGTLEWRSIRFEKEAVPYDDYQGTSVMNYAEPEVAFTRIHEPKHLHPEKEHKKGTSLIIKEFSEINPDEPYYPINTPDNQSVYQKYLDETKSEKNVIFGGRLGEYKYFDMHQSIAKALATYETKIKAVEKD